jgi:hypothetical protein
MDPGDKKRISKMLRDALRGVPANVEDPTTRQIQALMAVVKEELAKCKDKKN